MTNALFSRNSDVRSVHAEILPCSKTIRAIICGAFCSVSVFLSRPAGADVMTKFYRTTLDQDFREVVNAGWGDEWGPGSTIIDLDAAVERQTFRGLGGSFAEASCFTLMRLPEGKRTEAFEMLFGKTGLRLSIGRIHCAASDYSMHLYSYDPVAGDVGLGHFTIDDDKKWVIPAIREALKANSSLFLFSSPWSAPGWMKENGTMCGSRLKSDMFGVYADYVVKFLKAYRDEGIVISAHTPQNEVETEQSFNSPTMRMPAEDESRFVLTLKPRLDAAGLSTKIWILDHNYNLTNHVDAVLATPGVREAIAGIAWHSYEGEPEVVKRYRDICPDLENIHTEMGPHIDRSLRDFLWWGDLILRGFNAGQTGFTNWCLALDENGQPNTSCGFPCAGLIAIHSKTGDISPSNQYQAFRHVSPFVDVGAKVLEAPLVTGLPEGPAAKRVAQSVYSVFRNPNGRLVVVINHPSGSGAQYMLRLDGKYLPVVLLGRSLTTVVIDHRR